MYKKREIFIIIIIIAVTVVLAFLPSFLNKSGESDDVTESTTSEAMIEIKIEGEVTKSDLSYSVPYGTSYGYILEKCKIYLNTYSVIDKDFTKRYYEDTTIEIKSLDTGYDSLNEEVLEATDGKISIKTASKDILISLYGIGEKRAESIIEYRESNSIDSWETLKNLLGVSDEVIKSIQEKAVLE